MHFSERFLVFLRFHQLGRRLQQLANFWPQRFALGVGGVGDGAKTNYAGGQVQAECGHDKAKASESELGHG
ncbi:hypothetical protein ACFQAT_07070 [Undibacterium arcticum]|uniref:hypothetical protein n=1 Tax=Undibacterium arcticum TaxID=1762892 RepID=UPI00360D86A4